MLLDGHLLTAVYVFFYIISDLILPFYNKTLFSTLRISKEKDALSYPTTITFLQLSSISVAMISTVLFVRASRYIVFELFGSWIITVGKKRGIAYFDKFELNNKGKYFNDDSDHSHLDSFEDLENILSKKEISPTKLFFMKVKSLLLVSFAFTCVITLANLGLSKTGLNIYVLLRTTTMFWVITLSFFLKNERPSFFQIIFAVFVVSGAAIISMDNAWDSWNVDKGQIIGIIVNLVSAFCSGLQSVALRSTIQKVKQAPYNMSVLEITCYKLALSSIMIIIPAIILDIAIARPIFFEMFLKSIEIAIPFIIGGVIVTAMYQGAVVAVTSRAQALTVSLIHQMILLPQLIIYTIIDFSGILPKNAKIEIFKYSIPGITGAVLIVIGIIGYAGYRWFCDWKRRRDEELKKAEAYPILQGPGLIR